jgi:hypothetical protein
MIGHHGHDGPCPNGRTSPASETTLVGTKKEQRMSACRPYLPVTCRRLELAAGLGHVPSFLPPSLPDTLHPSPHRSSCAREVLAPAMPHSSRHAPHSRKRATDKAIPAWTLTPSPSQCAIPSSLHKWQPTNLPHSPLPRASPIATPRPHPRDLNSVS